MNPGFGPLKGSHQLVVYKDHSHIGVLFISVELVDGTGLDWFPSISHL